MAKTSPAEFVRQVRQEVGKVTFPTRRETTTSVILVIIMVTVASIFFLLADTVIHAVIVKILGFGG